MATVQRSAGARQRRFSKAEYYRMGELGFFRGQRVELIEGKIMVLSPQGNLHAGLVDLVGEGLRDLFGPGHRVRAQLPVDLGEATEPEPDLAVFVGSKRQFLAGHPTSPLLIVEISDTTLAYDRGRKASLYARAGIADYWIVNVNERQLEVYRDPVPDANEAFSHRYTSRTELNAGASVSPLARPAASVAVSELLP